MKKKLQASKELNVVGIMNGTSLDGIDFVLTRISRKNAKVKVFFVDQKNCSFPKKLQHQLSAATQNKLNVSQLSLLHHDLGRLYARELSKIKWKFDLIGLHGQTVFHAAPQATLQIGEPSYLAATFQVPVVADFRVADLAVGGQGAPIASLFHKVAFANQFKGTAIALHNLGGISNLTMIDHLGRVQKAFDTGPANILIDLLIHRLSKGKKKYDKDGVWAAKGKSCTEIVERIIREHKFFQKSPPKSCGREQFGEEFLDHFLKLLLKGKSKYDQVATVTDLTAQTIAQAYQKHIKSQPQKIILCGGGAKNKYLMKRIQNYLPKIEVLTTETFNWPVSAIEGGAFALLAAYRLWNLPANIPTTTGAKKSVLLGKIVEI